MAQEADAKQEKRAVVGLLMKNKVIVTPDLLTKLETVEQAAQWLALQTSTIRGEAKAPQENEPVKIVFNYTTEPKSRSVHDFVSLFNNRFSMIERILGNRQELKGLTSIGRISAKGEREKVSIVGMVYDKQETKNENLILVLEDQTGTIKVIVSKAKQQLYEIARDAVLDQVIGITGTTANGVIFANSIVLPEIPMQNELKRSSEPAAVVLLSDIEVGNKKFMAQEFDKFLQWLNGEVGNEEHKQLAKKVKYIIVAGDVVAGVGVYPGQEEDLAISDIKEQYRECARLLAKVPERIKIIIAPGNHDAVRISEPQPILNNSWAKPLTELKNAILVSNPAIVNIHSSAEFPGFNVLIYHGYGFDDYGENVYSIKNHGRQLSDRADLIMKFMLQARHLAPTYGSTLYIPEAKDNLVIDLVPDIFVSGHIHKAAVASYRGVLMVCGSCWQPKTDFQEKLGHDPDPCIVPIIDLETRKITMLNFKDGESKEAAEEELAAKREN